MKKVLALVALSLGLGGLARAQSAAATNSIALSSPPHVAPGQPVNPNAITPAELQELQLARRKAFQANPDLQKEAVALVEKMHAFQHKLDQEILQVDPKVAPVVTKIEDADRSGLIPSAPAHPPSPQSH